MKFEEITVGTISVKKVAVSAFEYFEDVLITKDCRGKMQHLWALNTSMLVNPLCKKMSKNKNYVCSQCYAKQMLSYRLTCQKRYERNFKALTSKILEYVPDLENEMVQATLLFRFEEFGDICNEVQALNYLLIAIANPSVKFGWWTKHINIIDAVLRKFGLSIPDNLSIVASSLQINKVSTHYKKYDFIDHIFTVYTGEYCDNHEQETNCSASSCYSCQRCYHKDGDFLINELLKQDARKRKK